LATLIAPRMLTARTLWAIKTLEKRPEPTSACAFPRTTARQVLESLPLSVRLAILEAMDEKAAATGKEEDSNSVADLDLPVELKEGTMDALEYGVWRGARPGSVVRFDFDRFSHVDPAE